jgi:hypothetical protein
LKKQQQQQLSTTAATDGNSANTGNTTAISDTIAVATANDIETVRAPSHGTTVTNISTIDHEQHPRDSNCGTNHTSSRSVVTTATA